ncbi:MAG: flagellar motor switch protein FliM [Bacillota bacterium]|nr:flagellar motor switch protein FliM [Bacillota bacterium]
MAEVLSQNEIDALLSALSSGEINEEELPKEEKQKVKVYDFKSPQKFSKEHIRTLEIVHENYARIISNYLTAQLRVNVKAKVESVQQITYEEFIRSIPNPTVLTLFKLPPIEGNILFEMNPGFAFKIIDILLGGMGGNNYKIREFTEIDKGIIFKINESLVSNMKLAWEDVLKVSPYIEGLETNPALNQTLAPNEPVALITFSVEMSESTSFINICIPYISVEKLLDKLVLDRYVSKRNDSDNETRNKVLENLNLVDVTLNAELGRTNITIDDFLKLNEGDVIKLSNNYREPITATVENKPFLKCIPGTVNKYKGLKIIEIIDKDVENDG